MSESISDEWDGQPDHPDPVDDLDYGMIDWVCVAAEQHGTDYLMFIPEEEQMLADDEFIVVEKDAVESLQENC